MEQTTVQHDIRSILDRALAAPRGICITAETPERAWYFRQRCYQARIRERDKFKKLHGVDYTGVAWDDLHLILQAEKLYIVHDAAYAEELSTKSITVEEL